MNKLIQFPFPVFITKEGKWFVAECPLLSIATQGRTEQELRDNMTDLIKEYIRDPDTSKERLRETTVSSSLTYIPVSLSGEILYGKT